MFLATLSSHFLLVALLTVLFPMNPDDSLSGNQDAPKASTTPKPRIPRPAKPIESLPSETRRRLAELFLDQTIDLNKVFNSLSYYQTINLRKLINTTPEDYGSKKEYIETLIHYIKEIVETIKNPDTEKPCENISHLQTHLKKLYNWRIERCQEKIRSFKQQSMYFPLDQGLMTCEKTCLNMFNELSKIIDTVFKNFSNVQVDEAPDQ